jgi:hypothetical protein
MTKEEEEEKAARRAERAKRRAERAKRRADRGIVMSKEEEEKAARRAERAARRAERAKRRERKERELKAQAKPRPAPRPAPRPERKPKPAVIKSTKPDKKPKPSPAPVRPAPVRPAPVRPAPRPVPVRPAPVRPAPDPKSSQLVVKAPALPLSRVRQATDRYLALATLNLVLVVAAVVVLAQVAATLSVGAEADTSVVKDALSGPLAAVAVAGLLGHFVRVTLAPTSWWVPALVAALVTLGAGVWAGLSPVPRAAAVPSAISTVLWAPASGEALEISGQTAAVLLVGLVFVSVIEHWRDGRYRLDAIVATTPATGSLLAAAAIVGAGLGYVFSVSLSALKERAGLTGAGLAGAYAGVVAGVAGLGFALLRALDRAIDLAGGVPDAFIPVPPGRSGAAWAVRRTQSAFSLALALALVLAACTAWQWHPLRPPLEGPIGKHLAPLGGALLAAPVLALISQAMRMLLRSWPGVFYMIRTAVFSAVLVVAGIWLVPWTYATLAVAGLAVAALAVRLTEPQPGQQQPAAALACAGLFVLGSLYYDAVSEGGSASAAFSTGMWAVMVAMPALLLAMGAEFASGGRPAGDYFVGYGTTVVRIYAAATLMQPLLTLALAMGDAEPVGLVPDNEPASVAADGLLMAALLMLASTALRAVVPEWVREGTRVGVLFYAFAGALVAFALATMRRTAYMAAFAARGQANASAVGDRLWADMRAPAPRWVQQALAV